MSAEVFISYASQDRERILDLVNRLDTAGVSVWIDQMSIRGRRCGARKSWRRSMTARF